MESILTILGWCLASYVGPGLAAHAGSAFFGPGLGPNLVQGFFGGFVFPLEFHFADDDIIAFFDASLSEGVTDTACKEKAVKPAPKCVSYSMAAKPAMSQR